MAKVLSINISEKTGEKKTPVNEASFVVGKGIEGDAHAGLSDIRQVSLLANESADKLRLKGLTLKCGDFAENITTEGINLHTLPIGTKLKIGNVYMEVSKIGKECHHGCAIKEQTGECVMPTEGIFTSVVYGGTIKVGEEITIV